MNKVALMGAGGKMGVRLATNLMKTDYDVLHVEINPKAQQRLIILEENQRAQLHDDLLNLSTEQFAKFAGKKSHDSPNRAREQLQQFSGWLNKREGEPFTAILDGANIGK